MSTVTLALLALIVLFQTITAYECTYQMDEFGPDCKLKTNIKTFDLDEYYKEAYKVQNDKIQLRNVLYNIIKSNVKYYSYSPCVANILKKTDEDPMNLNNVILMYTGQSFPKSQRGNSQDTWQNEHVWAKSHGFPRNIQGAYTDLNNLRPCYGYVNNRKSDYDFKEGGDKLCLLPFESTTDDCQMMSHKGDRTFEPPNIYKGEVARIMFYMELMYGSDLSLSVVDSPTISGNPAQGFLTDLLKWSEEYPKPSNMEIQRNNRVHCIQGNRNPFIDHPEWISVIYGGGKLNKKSISTPAIIAIVIVCSLFGLFIIGFAYKSYKGYKGLERVPLYSVFERIASCCQNRGQQPIRLEDDEAIN